MSYPITHVVVQNTPPPNHVVTIGHLYSIPADPETVFSTVTRAVEEDVERWEDDGGEAETKVLRPRRGRRPKANEAAETK